MDDLSGLNEKDGGKYVKEYILEACVDSVESAMAAVEGGADRLELCGNLIIGGTTPGPWLFDEIRKRSDIRIHALIRPRFGDFCYTDAEFSMIKHAVEDFRKMGAEGVVFGVLKPDGTLNMEQMKELMEAAGDMSRPFTELLMYAWINRNNGTGNLTGNQYDPYFRPAQCMSAGADLCGNLRKRVVDVSQSRQEAVSAHR